MRRIENTNETIAEAIRALEAAASGIQPGKAVCPHCGMTRYEDRNAYKRQQTILSAVTKLRKLTIHP